ncbi:DUF2059 domain-containing protein [Pelomonas sp. CA6]|uniref:DUF2059 domain-containing protein n=1 Tax=Pelomonas sp. CA6 TaxID=2907999 RepID=UPI001F4BD73F|nr:DUF2059 domain-containing protein [Pelomonas sp. CA6]MCH7345691.1 DUF2059 domain-containing protein [Pelomonas sp. CA6]
MSRSTLAFARRALTAALLTVGLCAAVQAQEAAVSAEQRADIERLMEVTGAAKLGLQMADLMSAQMMRAISQRDGGLTPQQVDEVRAVVMEVVRERMEGPQGLMAQIVPLYACHFSAQEIKDLLAFYASPTGAKAVAVMPALMQESVQLGAGWGEAIGPEIGRRVSVLLKKYADARQSEAQASEASKADAKPDAKKPAARKGEAKKGEAKKPAAAATP